MCNMNSFMDTCTRDLVTIRMHVLLGVILVADKTLAHLLLESSTKKKCHLTKILLVL